MGTTDGQAPDRTVDFRRSGSQEALLRDLNSLLGQAERIHETRVDTPAMPRLPIVFVVGAPRSGTTLTMQWLAASGHFAYPTNLLARFYGAPFVGAQIQRLLTDPEMDFHGELSGDIGDHVDWQSDIGKTRGLLQPHEFSYFWRRFLPVCQARRLSDDEWNGADVTGFCRGWAKLEAAFGLPVATKGILGQFNITELADALPTAVFLFTRRDPFFNAQSLLHAREQVFGTRDRWYSVQPPGWRDLLALDPIDQVVHQVQITNDEIERQLAELPTDRWVLQPYEQFCSDPATTWRVLQDAMQTQGHDLLEHPDDTTFEATNQVRLDDEDAARVRRAVHDATGT